MGIHVPTITKVITMRNVGNDYFFSFPLLLHNWFRVGFVQEFWWNFLDLMEGIVDSCVAKGCGVGGQSFGGLCWKLGNDIQMLIDDVVRASVGHEEDNAKDLTTRGMGRGGGGANCMWE